MGLSGAALRVDGRRGCREEQGEAGAVPPGSSCPAWLFCFPLPRAVATLAPSLVHTCLSSQLHKRHTRGELVQGVPGGVWGHPTGRPSAPHDVSDKAHAGTTTSTADRDWAAGGISSELSGGGEGMSMEARAESWLRRRAQLLGYFGPQLSYLKNGG